jgi:hypothetical protein
MSNPLLDEADLTVKLTSTLRGFVAQFGHPPVSTSILFEPYHEFWGIYQSSRQMCCDDSPGDYEIQNAEVGTITAPDLGYDQAAFTLTLQTMGGRLVSSLVERVRPSTLGLELDYERVWTFPGNETTSGPLDHGGQPATRLESK